MIHQTLLLTSMLLFASLVQANTFIMWAEGDGKTLKDAKASAVTALSQQVISKVESSFKTELSVNKNEVNRNSKSVKQIDSSLILKGVIYVDEMREGDNIKITAGLDKAAIHSTIDYMKKQLDANFAILNRDKKEEALLISDQLTAFVSVLPGNILNEFENIEAWNKHKRELILKNLFMGRVVFVSNRPDYKVEVDGKPIESGVFLEEGNYEFSASTEGRRTMRGNFFASGGETVKVKLNFIQTISNKKMSLKLPEEYEFVRDNLENILSDLGINVSSGQDHSLVVKVKDTGSDVDGYVSHHLKIRIEVHKNSERVKKVTVRKSFVIQKGDDQIVQDRINRYIRKGTVALMSRIDLDEYFSSGQ